MEQLSFKLEKFEGPLDLLLTLIKKNKVNIYDIPISQILDQYMAVVSEMQMLDLELSSEFLVLAATLLQIKSKMLLPKDEDDESDEADPRAELVRRLIEYKQIKESTEFFREHEGEGYAMFFKLPDAIERPKAALNYSSLTPDALLAAFKSSFSKLERRMPPPKRSFEGIVGHEKVSVREKVKKIWTGLIKKGKMLFKDIFRGAKSKPEAVAMFLAVLEMVKMNKIAVDGGMGKDLLVKKITDDSSFDFEEIED